MKAVYCAACGDIRGLRPGVIVACGCGSCMGWWRDPHRGIAEFAECDWTRQLLSEPVHLHVLGIHNDFLTEPSTIKRYRVWEEADGYLFKTYESVIIRIRPGSSSDTTFVSDLSTLEAVGDADPAEAEGEGGDDG